jgi:hypothetical protein
MIAPGTNLPNWPQRVMTYADLKPSPAAAALSPLLSIPFCGPAVCRGITLGVEPFRRHMTDEAWLLESGLDRAGFTLCGPRYKHNSNDVRVILEQEQPSLVIIEDRREWITGGIRKEQDLIYSNLEALTQRDDIFRVTIFKDAGSIPREQYQHHQILRPHFLIVYYHEQAVLRLAPWVRSVQLVRTYHAMDPATYPPLNLNRPGRETLLSGALNACVYPLRTAADQWTRTLQLHGVSRLPHPGYHANGTTSAGYLRQLNQYRVHLATASAYGFALRKIIESVACGCTPVTTLPAEDVLPEIDAALVRVPHNMTAEQLGGVLRATAEAWQPERAEHFANLARQRYDYRRVYGELAADIHRLYATRRGNF